jgi:hypothetical protein
MSRDCPPRRVAASVSVVRHELGRLPYLVVDALVEEDAERPPVDLA